MEVIAICKKCCMEKCVCWRADMICQSPLVQRVSCDLETCDYESNRTSLLTNIKFGDDMDLLKKSETDCEWVCCKYCLRHIEYCICCTDCWESSRDHCKCCAKCCGRLFAHCDCEYGDNYRCDKCGYLDCDCRLETHTVSHDSDDLDDLDDSDRCVDCNCTYCMCDARRCDDCGCYNCEGNGECEMYRGVAIPPEPCDCCMRHNCICSMYDTDSDSDCR